MPSPSVTKRPYVLSSAEGDAFWFAGRLMVAKVTGAETELPERQLVRYSETRLRRLKRACPPLRPIPCRSGLRN